MLLKGEGVNKKLIFSKNMLNFIAEARYGNCFTSNLSQTGIWGRCLQPPEAMGNFLKVFVIFGKIAILMPFGSHFALFRVI